MRIKKYVARSLPEALAQVKHDLGPDAVILHTNEVKVGGLFGLFGTRMIQVMAAVEQEAPAGLNGPRTVSPPVRSPATAQQAPAQQPPALQASPPAVVPPPARPVVASALPGGEGAATALAADVADMRNMISQLMDQVSLPNSAGRLEPELKEMLASLLNGGIQEQEAMSLVQRVRTRILKGEATLHDASDCARDLIQRELGKVQPVDQQHRVVALVGPTGVGKTTTLAKLAAHFALQRGLDIAMITADTYRIAAVDQLRTYSEILNVPLEIVYEAREIGPALQRLGKRDLILVDTAGRSPRNEAHMQELKEYLEVLEADETYLVMSMTSGYRDAVTIVESYVPLGFDRFLFTKWDEAAGPGLIYNLVRRYRRPLSYITTGQSVPDDIETADPVKITRAILGV